MRRFTVRDITLAAMVAALYAVMGYFGNIFGLTFGPVQCRFAEALTVLPFVFPAAVGPVRIINGLFFISIPLYHTILLNFFSSSRLDMAMMVGLPCGQWYGFFSVKSSPIKA